MPWQNLQDDQLLEKRICDLNLKIIGTKLEKRIETLYTELDEKGLSFRPPCYLADEWFVMDDEIGIAIPFYLADSRLEQLEEKIILDVEGKKYKEFLKLIRHEAGHAFCHAYKIAKRKKFREVFGRPVDEIPKSFRPKPYSRNFVRHLDNWYSQIDPEEDFAETFAVWLNPDSKWREAYKGWRVLKKLEFVDQLMKELCDQKPKLTTFKHPCSSSKLKSKLSTYYRLKKREFEEDYPDFFDADLKKFFSNDPEYKKGASGRVFMKKNRKSIVNAITTWTREKKFAVDGLYKQLMERAGELELKICYDEQRTISSITAFLTAIVSNRIHTGKSKRIP